MCTRRKVCFLPASGKAVVKRLAPTNTDALIQQDRAAIQGAARGLSRWVDRPVLSWGDRHAKDTRGGGGRLALVRSILTEIINKQTDAGCVGAAADPLIAREMIPQPQPPTSSRSTWKYRAWTGWTSCRA